MAPEHPGDRVAAGVGQGRPTTVETESGIKDLADWLLSPRRERPVVVVTTPAPGVKPPVDPHAVAAAYGSVLDVYVVANGPLTYALSNALPRDTGVYGGGARLYPRGDSWHANPYSAPLYLCRNAAETDASTARLRQVLNLLLSARNDSDPPGSRPQPATARRDHAADGTVVSIDTVAQARDLAQTLLDPQRTVPMVVVSVHPDADGPYLDADQLASDVRGAAAVFLVGAEATYGLTQGLGNRQLSVFYGAGRVYPVGQDWLTDMYAAPLHMCPTPGAAERAADRIVTDALLAGYRAGTLAADRRQPGDRRTVAQAQSPMGPHHVLMRTQDGQQALMLAAHLSVDVPMARLLKKGQRLDGHLRGTGLLPEFIPDPIDDDPLKRCRDAYPDGSEVLARVASVSTTGATVWVHPQVDGMLDAGAADDVLALLSPGDVIVCRIRWSDAAFTAELLDTEQPHTLLTGVSLLPDGPPWLLPADLEIPEPEAEAAAEPAPAGPTADLPSAETGRAMETAVTSPEWQIPPSAPAPVVTAPGPATQPGTADTTRLEQQLRTARDAAAALAVDLGRAEGLLERRDAELKRIKQELRKAKQADRSRKQKAAEQAAAVFADPARQLRHEICLAFLARIPEAERETKPLPDNYRIGPQLLASIDALEGISRDKVIDVIVEVLTGLAKDIPGRQLHPWTAGKSGPQEQRADGGKAWRVSLQTKTPGARRLKYWALPGGVLELDSIGHHDQGLA